MERFHFSKRFWAGPYRKRCSQIRFKKPIPEYYGGNTSSGSASKNNSEVKALKKAMFLEAIQSQEVIELISVLEKETSDQKLGEDVSWKQRLPKKKLQVQPRRT